ncbi:MAG TPA: NADH-quinone oxidoreductase subunit J, partial [Acidimicrobiia bacterium]
LFAAGVTLFGDFEWVPAASATFIEGNTNGTIQAIAEPLFTDWVLAFEATALLLTIAAAAAVVLAQFKRKRS